MASFTRNQRAIRSLHSAALALVSALALTLLAVPSASVASTDDEAVGVSLRPADSSGAFDGRSNFRYQVDPGQSVIDHAAVVNTGAESQVFTIIGTDAFNNETGDFSLLPTDTQPERVGTWVTFENGTNRLQLTLAPGEGRLVPFTVTLPAEATPGDHAGGIVASVVTGGQVQLDRRVAVRLYTRVSGDLQPRLSISGMDASFAGDWWNPLAGAVTVRYTVDNPGNVALAANVNGGVKTWFGIPVATPRGGGIPEILPGNSSSYEFTASAGQWLYLNPYLELVPFVDSDDVSMYVPVAPVSRDTVLFVMPWVLLIVLALAALVWGGIVWRRRRIEAQTQAWIEYTQNQAREEAEREAGLVGAGTQSQNG